MSIQKIILLFFILYFRLSCRYYSIPLQTSFSFPVVGRFFFLPCFSDLLSMYICCVVSFLHPCIYVIEIGLFVIMLYLLRLFLFYIFFNLLGACSSFSKTIIIAHWSIHSRAYCSSNLVNHSQIRVNWNAIFTNRKVLFKNESIKFWSSDDWLLSSN